MTIMMLIILFKADNFIELKVKERFSNRSECELAIAQKASQDTKYNLLRDKMKPSQIIAQYENSADLYVVKCIDVKNL